MIKICFISLNSYPLFKKKSLGYFGGAEVQISRVVQYLAKNRRFLVSLVVADYGQKPKLKFGRLTLYTGMRHSFPFQIEVLRFLLTLKKVNADIYVERTANVKVGLVYLFCKLFKKKFIYMVAHDWDIHSNHNSFLKGLAQSCFVFGLKQANLIVAQTKQQQKQLRKYFDRPSILMRSVVRANKQVNKKINREIILWVGRADRWKRPKAFILLAKKLPGEKFVMICRQGNDRKFFNKTKQLAKLQPNLKWLEAVSYDDILGYFQQAKALVNTSMAEGFPNTFLQAGLAKIPILSLKVNPDNFIIKYNCGFWAKNSFPVLVKTCQSLINNQKLARHFGSNNFQYVKKFHSIKNVRLFTQILFNHFSRTID